MSSKVCTCCGELKDLDEFNLSNVAKDGRTSRCTECLRLYNKERYKKYGKQSYLEHKIARATAMKKWRKKNPDYIKGWRNNNPEYDKEWYISSICMGFKPMSPIAKWFPKEIIEATYECIIGLYVKKNFPPDWWKDWWNWIPAHTEGHPLMDQL